MVAGEGSRGARTQTHPNGWTQTGGLKQCSLLRCWYKSQLAPFNSLLVAQRTRIPHILHLNSSHTRTQIVPVTCMAKEMRVPEEATHLATWPGNRPKDTHSKRVVQLNSIRKPNISPR
jgi:hypothetical protein